MKKSILALVVFGLIVVPAFSLGETLGVGSKSNEVKELQGILKQNPKIYPEGLTTGYYGRLTTDAVKRLQANNGIAETGIVDAETRELIWPSRIELTVISPNGGEVWNKNENHFITWKTTSSPNRLESENSISSQSFSPRVSIDLIRDSNKAVYHVGTANLYESQFSWRIPSRVPDASDYRVRITVGGTRPCAYPVQPYETDDYYPCPLDYFEYRASDMSDNTFKITNGNDNNDDTISFLKNRVRELNETIRRLQNVVRELEALIDRLS